MCIDVLIYENKNVTSHIWDIVNQGSLILLCQWNLFLVENLPYALFAKQIFIPLLLGSIILTWKKLRFELKKINLNNNWTLF